MTDSTQSRARPQSLIFNDNNNNDEKRISTSSNETDSSTTSSSSAASYHPPPVLPANTAIPSSTSPTQSKRGEPQFRANMIGDETKCRRKFVKMVQAAYNFQMEHKDLIPKEMDILFNAQDNVQSIRLYINNQAEYHKFCGYVLILILLLLLLYIIVFSLPCRTCTFLHMLINNNDNIFFQELTIYTT